VGNSPAQSIGSSVITLGIQTRATESKKEKVHGSPIFTMIECVTNCLQRRWPRVQQWRGMVSKGESQKRWLEVV